MTSVSLVLGTVIGKGRSGEIFGVDDGGSRGGPVAGVCFWGSQGRAVAPRGEKKGDRGT